jgi:uroporphyrinogen-III synthase
VVSTPADRPLAGRRILVTREPRRAGSLRARLEALGADVEAHSAIAFEPPREPERARAAIEHLGDYDWIVFGSVNGVRFFELAGGCHAAAGAPRGLRVAAVGPATARALRERGIDPCLTAAESHAGGLAREMLERVRPGQRVLIVRPEVASGDVAGTLRRAGARADDVAFYRTVAAAGAPALARRVAARAFDTVVFTSPSNLRCLLAAAAAEAQAVWGALSGARRVAIGPATTRALEDAALDAHATADSPDEGGIVDAVLRGCGA